MDKRDNNGFSYYGRRVTGSEQETNTAHESGVRSRDSFERRKHNNKKRSSMRLRTKRIRAAIILLLLVVLVIILIFMTPVFNIRQITVDGNNRVSIQEVDAQIHDIAGQNLFRTSSGKIKKSLREIAYIDDAHVTKHIFPPSISVSIRECIPAGYMVINGSKIIIDKDLKVLSDDKYKNEKIPEILGIETERYVVGKKLEPFDAEKRDILSECLSTMYNTGILDKIENIDVSSVTGIKFRYDDRIDALCGTHLDLDRKIRLFKETVSSPSIADDAKGIIDLSVTGKAVYTP